ncbi:DUF547 domain-containing protein [Parashewanella spongiae]|uniref:DUF547 domain-containing protein n=1 Tax=Parashewanella spongiae TaxID=342950 RepID=A0A3A6TY93_9GAMM|nr:DUF547 domain-containing protein [Parashewanella spongiae]MCL1077739.1 DUF547 domain-containing protein [Parashewanella spongiae]RJY18060.1 DUF547 domain-containing protein [Parashewanella spongiae]
MTKFKFLMLLVSLVFIGVSIKAYCLYQAISPNGISYWNTSNETNQQKIDHNLWQQFLSKYLTSDEELSIRYINYGSVNNEDRKILDKYLNQLQSIDPRHYQKDVQLAYWINLYNALTVQIVLEHYPIESIKNIGDGFTGPWNMELVTISGQAVTLNQIEHGILRAFWKDNRVHYVINCASIGCPDLPTHAFSSDNIEQQFNIAAIRFVNQEKAVKFIDGKLHLSSIYSWFSEDFGSSTSATIEHVKQFAKPTLKAQLDEFSAEVEFEYDWRLNENKSR